MSKCYCCQQEFSDSSLFNYCGIYVCEVCLAYLEDTYDRNVEDFVVSINNLLKGGESYV